MSARARHGGAPAARGAGLRRARGAGGRARGRGDRGDRRRRCGRGRGRRDRPGRGLRGLGAGGARIGAAERVHAELPFAFTLATGGGRSLLIDGIVDVHAREGHAVLVVDYKSDRLEGGEPAERVEGAYAIQQLVYALAALRSGAARAEVAYCFLERPDDPVAPRLSRGGRPGARGRAARAHRRACPRAASSPPPSRTAACAPTAPGGRRCAAGTRTARWPTGRSGRTRATACGMTLGAG